MATYELSYAGSPLTVPTAEVLAWIDAQLGSAGLRPPGPPGWPATKLAGLSSFAFPAHFRCRVGSLYWPRGVSRFAVGHFLASTDQLNDIYAAMPAGEAATLVLDTGDSRGKVSTSMSMLPARPLAAFEGYADTKGLYLLTLVDARYWLWGKWTSDAVTVTDDTTPWGDMVAAAALDLGITLTHDTVDPADWGYAPNGLDLAGEPAPLALDAICYACGLRVARKLDGSYEARNCDTDRTNVQANLGGLAAVRMSGGAFSLDRGDLPPGIDTVDDQPLALPETVRLVVLADDGLHTVDAALQDQDDAFEAVRTGVARAWAVNWQTYDAGAAGLYLGALGRAEGVRTLAAVARRFAGVVPWAPEGVSEAVEWVYRIDDACTVVHPAAWSDGVMEVVGNAGSCACDDPGAGFVEQEDKCHFRYVAQSCADGVMTTTETAITFGVPAKCVFTKVTTTALEEDPTWVSYVGITPPDGVSVTPMFTTGADTFVFSWDDQPAHYALIGPASGADAPPTWRLFVTADIPDGIVTRPKLSDGTALSVIGRSANSTGAVADIAAAADDRLLARVSSALAFTQLTVGMFPANVVTDAKLRQSAGLSVIGRATNSTGDVADITAANDGEVLRRSGTAVGFSQTVTASYANDSVTFAKIQNITDGNLLGRSAGSDGDMQHIAVGTGLSLGSGTLICTVSAYTDEQAQDAVAAMVTDTATVAWTYNDAANTLAANVPANAITDAKLRQGAAVSVVGRSANSTGNVADIAAGADDRVLARTSSALGFVQLTVGMFPANVVTNAKLAQMAAHTVKSNITGSTADAADNGLSAIINALLSPSEGDSFVWHGGALYNLGAGGANQALVGNGAGSLPSFKTATIGGTGAITYNCDGTGTLDPSGLTIVWT